MQKSFLISAHRKLNFFRGLSQRRLHKPGVCTQVVTSQGKNLLYILFAISCFLSGVLTSCGLHVVTDQDYRVSYTDSAGPKFYSNGVYYAISQDVRNLNAMNGTPAFTAGSVALQFVYPTCAFTYDGSSFMVPAYAELGQNANPYYSAIQFSGNIYDRKSVLFCSNPAVSPSDPYFCSNTNTLIHTDPFFMANNCVNISSSAAMLHFRDSFGSLTPNGARIFDVFDTQMYPSVMSYTLIISSYLYGNILDLNHTKQSTFVGPPS